MTFSAHKQASLHNEVTSLRSLHAAPFSRLLPASSVKSDYLYNYSDINAAGIDDVIATFIN